MTRFRFHFRLRFQVCKIFQLSHFRQNWVTDGNFSPNSTWKNQNTLTWTYSPPLPTTPATSSPPPSVLILVTDTVSFVFLLPLCPWDPPPLTGYLCVSPFSSPVPLSSQKPISLRHLLVLILCPKLFHPRRLRLPPALVPASSSTSCNTSLSSSLVPLSSQKPNLPLALLCPCLMPPM